MKYPLSAFLLALVCAGALPAPLDLYDRTFLTANTIKGPIEMVVIGDECMIRPAGGEALSEYVGWSAMIPLSALNLLQGPGDNDAFVSVTFCIAPVSGSPFMGGMAIDYSKSIEVTISSDPGACCLDHAAADASAKLKDYDLPPGWTKTACN
jgi:hypothetical protein